MINSQHAHNMTALAKAIGISRKTLYEWNAREDSPNITNKRRIEIQPWLDYAESVGCLTKSDTGDNQEPVEQIKDAGLLRVKKLEEEVKKLEITNAIKAGELMPIADVIDIFSQFADEWKKTIENSGLDKIEKDKCFKSLQMASERIGRRSRQS